jgi:hypothetical protein
MTARSHYETGLRAGYCEDGIGPDGDPADPYWAGFKQGRASWRRDTMSALIVDRPPLLPPSDQMYLLVKARSERIVAGLPTPAPEDIERKGDR